VGASCSATADGKRGAGASAATVIVGAAAMGAATVAAQQCPTQLQVTGAAGS
jgi:hypothetical protein